MHSDELSLTHYFAGDADVLPQRNLHLDIGFIPSYTGMSHGSF